MIKSGNLEFAVKHDNYSKSFEMRVCGGRVPGESGTFFDSKELG